MRPLLFVVFALGAATALLPLRADAQVQAGVVFDRDGLRTFHLAIGHVYGVPAATLVRYAPARIHPEELPVVYFLAREARVSPETVIALREYGWSWVDITWHLGLDPYIFVAHLPARVGPPYGVAHGYWRKRGRTHVRYLSDREIVDFVNASFWASYYRVPVTRVIVVRERYPSWVRYAALPPAQAAPRTAVPREVRATPAPSRAAPAPSRAAPAPSRATPAPSRATPAPSRAGPAPTRATPSPSRASPAPSRAAPAPSRAAPTQSRAAPTPSRAAPAPSRAAPAPSRAAPPAQRATPAPSRASPAPSRTPPASAQGNGRSAPTPAASRPAASRGAGPPPARGSRRGGG